MDARDRSRFQFIQRINIGITSKLIRQHRLHEVMRNREHELVTSQPTTVAQFDSRNASVVNQQSSHSGLHSNVDAVFPQRRCYSSLVDFVERNGRNGNLPSFAAGQKPVDENFPGMLKADPVKRLA